MDLRSFFSSRKPGRRRKLLVYGNCQGEAIARYLRRDPAVTEMFDVAYHFVDRTEEEFEAQAREADEADIVLAQDVQNWASYPFRETAEAKKLIRYPFLYFAPLWPFDAHQNTSDDVALAARAHLPAQLNFDFQDALLARLRTEIPDPEDRYEAYCKLEYKRPINIKRYLAAEVARLEAQDQRSSSKTGRFIIENFARKRLFHTITHPTIEVIAKMAEEACAAAGIRCGAMATNAPDYASAYQVPLHPHVIEALGIKWADNHTRYNFRDRQLTFDAYVRAYIFVYG